MYMLLVPVIRLVFFRDKGTPPVWFAVALGVAGMYLLCVTEGFRLTRGDTLVCLCAVGFSAHILCCDHFAGRADPVAVSAVQFATATVLSAAAAFLTETPTWDKLAGAAVPILYCGIVSGGIGYTLQITALMSMESVFAVLAGAVLLSERMTGREALGCAVMFAAIILVQLPSRAEA